MLIYYPLYAFPSVYIQVTHLANICIMSPDFANCLIQDFGCSFPKPQSMTYITMPDVNLNINVCAVFMLPLISYCLTLCNIAISAPLHPCCTHGYAFCTDTSPKRLSNPPVEFRPYSHPIITSQLSSQIPILASSYFTQRWPKTQILTVGLSKVRRSMICQRFWKSELYGAPGGASVKRSRPG